MRSRILKLEFLENRRMLHGDGVQVTPTAVITEHDTVPRFAAEANFIAVQSGDWSNPLTWNTRQVPGESAKVRIPNGIDVTTMFGLRLELMLLRFLVTRL